MHAGEHRAPLRQQRAFEPGALIDHHVAQPVVAPAQHFDEQFFDARYVVVQVREQPFDVVRGKVLRFDQLDRRARRLGIERAGVLNALRLRAELRQHRHLARQRGAQRIDGLDAQARRAIGDAPAARAVARYRRARELVRAALVSGCGRRACDHLRKCLEHALAHFRGGFPGERNGDNFLGLVHGR